MIRCVALLLCAGTLLLAQPEPTALFPSQAEVFVDASGLSRLEMPPAVLTQLQGDLSDLRLFDAQGREVPYLIDRGQPQPERTITQRSYRSEIVAVDREVTEAGDREPSSYSESYELALPDEATLDGSWHLVVETGVAEFVRRIDISAAGRGGSRNSLLDGGSLFRLREGRIERTTFDLPGMPSHGLHLKIDGAGGGFLSPQFVLLQGNSIGASTARLVDLTIVDRTDTDGRTELTLERPRGLQVTALQFSTTSSAFIRPVRVADVRTGQHDTSIGRPGQIFRIPAAVAVENLKVDVGAMSGDRLRISIQNQDSPALENVTVSALTATPALLFSLPAGETATLRFGGGRASTPRYDLEALMAVLSTEGFSADRAIGEPTQARLGPVAENGAYSAGPLLGFASRPGAAVDDRSYSHVRRVDLAPSTEGLSRLELSVEDLSHASPDYADLRLVDANSAQWAYLAQSNARREWLPIVAGVEHDTESSVYSLQLPASPVLLDGVRVSLSDEFFDRPYSLTIRSDGRDRLVAQGRLTRAADGREVDPIEIAFTSIRGESLELEISNGNDAPLSTLAVDARFPLPDLFTVAPAGSYRLLTGNPDAEAPVYELERAAATVLAARSSPVELGGLTSNPMFDSTARLTTGAGSERALFWIALLVAVGVLARMTLKTVRNES
jgi:hypothetical protein